MEIEDRELVSRVLAGRTDDFRVLVERHQVPVFRFASALVGNREEAEDIAPLIAPFAEVLARVVDGRVRDSMTVAAVLRAHQEFALTTTLAVLDALLFAFAVIVGLWLAGLWGLWVAVGLLFSFNIAYLHARHPLRFHWAWEWPIRRGTFCVKGSSSVEKRARGMGRGAWGMGRKSLTQASHPTSHARYFASACH